MDEATRQDELTAINARLEEISSLLYGERAHLRVVDPGKVRLLGKNARYMKKPTFDQLAANVQADGMLQSVPLCQELTDGAGLECLSGNHRIKAAIKAGLDRVLVLVIPEQAPGEKIARQLSHNALVGEDDKQILAELWRELDTLQDRLYSGLDSEMMKELDKISFQGLNAESVRIERVVLWFLPEEVEELDRVVDLCSEVAASDHLYLAPLAKYETLWKALVDVKKLRNIKNTAVAFMVLIEEVEEVLRQRAGSDNGSTPADQAEGGGSTPPQRS